MATKFGVAITTLNRRSVYNTTIAHYRRFTPSDVPIVVVDDGSDIPAPDATIRNHTPCGIARAKNQCIAALLELGCDNLFLSDDDCYPTENGWWQPYLDSGEHHLSLQLRWEQVCPKCLRKTRHNYNTTRGHPTCEICKPAQAVYENDKIHAVQWGSGVFLYFTRECIDRIGGFRTEYGQYGIEHWDIAYRAMNAGMIRFPFQDVLDPKLYAVDCHTRGVRSVVPKGVRAMLLERNWVLFNEKYKDSKDFVPYTEPDPTTLATVCMPWRAAPARIAAHDRCVRFWKDNGYKVIEADSFNPAYEDLGFLCSRARNNAVAQATTPIVIVADADTIPADIAQVTVAVQMVNGGDLDVVWPFNEYRHIPNEWVEKDDLGHAPVQQTYVNSPGGIIVAKVETFWDIGGFDERFTPGLSDSGSCFGYDDTAFYAAASTLYRTGRINGIVYSFNHATNAAGRPDRDFGNANPNKALYKLFEFARGKPDIMRALIKR